MGRRARQAGARPGVALRLTLVAVGRSKPGPLRALFDDYAGRLAAGPWGPLRLVEVEERRPLTGAARQAREAALLTAALPKGALRFALDERGRALDSAAFAELLQRSAEQGTAELAFLVGGADGFAPALRAEADRLISLGPMTWPHMLVRALLAEQLFRAQSILTGHPYHRA